MKKLFSLLMLVVLVSSCRKSDRDYDSSVLASSDQTMSDVYVSNIFLAVDEAAKVEYSIIPTATSGYLDCPTVSSNLVGTPNTVTIDFGSGCTLPDGRVWRGQIYATIELNGTYSDSGTVTTVDLIDFSIDDFNISGSIDFANRGLNDSMNQVIRHNFTDLTIDHASPDWTAYLTSTGTRELVAGDGNLDVSDDEYEISLNASGRSRSGNYFTATTLTPLLFTHDCQYIRSGTMEIAPDNLVPRILDFGTGDCDTTVIVTINQTQHYVALP